MCIQEGKSLQSGKSMTEESDGSAEQAHHDLQRHPRDPVLLFETVHVETRDIEWSSTCF